jgi:DNA-binding MarR family transcriptional regulator
MSARRKPAPVSTLDAARIGFEGRAAVDDHLAVKNRLRQRFGTTLPRFDYLAQLERHPEGLRMNALSRYLMVTGGNVTGLTDQLVAQGLVERTPDALDRRSLTVRLTDAGRQQFALMAHEHEAWLTELFDGCDAGFKEALYEMLGRLRVHLAHQDRDARAERPTAPAKSSKG